MRTTSTLVGLSLLAALVASVTATAPASAEPRSLAFSPQRFLDRPALPRAPSPTDAIVVESHVRGSGEDDTGQCLSLCGASSADVVIATRNGDRIAIFSRLWGHTLRAGEASITYGLAGSGLRFRLAPAIWLDSGVGVAHVSIDRDDEVDVVALTSVTPAALVAAGADLGALGGFDFDVHARAGTSLYAMGVPVRDALVSLRARW